LFRKVTEEQVAQGFDAALFGHSHMPALESVEVDGRSGWFGNCGDWVQHRTYLRLDEDGFVLEELSDPERAPLKQVQAG
jgi:UDP-2,3-diacylglucosamine pyrophosphatase LpxH